MIPGQLERELRENSNQGEYKDQVFKQDGPLQAGAGLHEHCRYQIRHKGISKVDAGEGRVFRGNISPNRKSGYGRKVERQVSPIVEDPRVKLPVLVKHCPSKDEDQYQKKRRIP